MRVATTVQKEDGTSAVGTPLASNSSAMGMLNMGEPYYGGATIFRIGLVIGYLIRRSVD
jgi:hypothetical protein